MAHDKVTLTIVEAHVPVLPSFIRLRFQRRFVESDAAIELTVPSHLLYGVHPLIQRDRYGPPRFEAP